MEPKFNELLIDSLNNTIKDMHSSMLSTINAGVVFLFWDIGTQINSRSNNNIEDQDILVKKLSDDLLPIFGDHLSVKNLLLMKQFATKCSLATIDKISTAVNWEYIPHFFNLEEENAWVFYMKLIHIKSLYPTELIKEIELRKFEKEGISDENTFGMSFSKPFYRNTSDLYFGKQHGPKFHKLFKPQDKDDLTIAELLSKNASNKMVMNIFRRILDFQYETHFVLNLQFNTLLLTIGSDIIQLSKIKNIPLDSINYFTQELGKYLPSIFNKEVLSYCIKFAEKYNHADQDLEIIEIVSWPYVKIILDVDDTKKHIFIAKQVFNNGIGLDELKALISHNKLDFKNIFSWGPRKYNSITTETKDGSDIIEIIETTIKLNIHPVHDLNRNIFKNDELLTFLGCNLYLD